MAKQLNVNLGFTADTSQAAAQLQQLQKQLQDLVLIGGQKTSSLGLTKELTQATEKAAELKIALEGATNPKTGMLDLSKFNANLQKSNTSIQEYAQHLYSLGPAGQQAFSQLASSINQAEIPLKRSSKMLTEFATTLKNTARWQISSSILHGFMGTVQSAWRYAQNLNASLNDIRIVTGANVDKMAQFAEQANRSAKALSTTTNKYTKASLIYYQQGLDDQAVKERTDVTIKMANVSGQSAETVSDQMTAVWNNFAKGGDDLERFADVMVRLGADTASSSDEIAQGLEKFAAIGDMVGLSFDNAAAALATVTATTRQSADIVGTAFKTIFARIQGLKLGETLEDGTDLNKYSEALATVGISIKEQNGELKDMDTILAEMGAKWQTLSKDQQVALAQTVAGVRQYNQLVALMDNFDFYEQNLERAENADGSLQKQADIYAESWEAASKRVTAAAEDIYDSLLDDKFFIKLTDGFAGILNIIGDTIDGIGGMKGAIALLGVVITRVFSQDIASSLERFSYNIQSFTKAGREKMFNKQLAMKQEANQALRDFQNDGTAIGAVRADVNQLQANAYDRMALRAKELLDSGRQLSDVEQRKMQIMSDQLRILGDQAIQAATQREQSEKTAENLERQLKTRMTISSGGKDTLSYKNFDANIKEAKELQTQYSMGTAVLDKFEKELSQVGSKGKVAIRQNITSYIKEFIQEANKAGIEIGELQELLNKIGKNGMSFDAIKGDITEFRYSLEDLGGRAQIVFDNIVQEAERMEQAGQMNPQQLRTFISTLEQLQQEFIQTGQFTEEQIATLRDLGIQVDATGKIIQGFQGKIPTMANGIVALGNIISSVTMTITSLKGIVDTWNNEDATFGEKLIATFTTLGMVIPIVVTAFQQQNLAQMATMSSAIASALGLGTLSAAEIAAGLAGEAGAAGTVSFSTALWNLLWPIGLVIAAIAALVAIIWALSNSLNAEENSTKAAEQTLESLSSAYEQAKKRAEAFKETVSNYDSAIEALDGLKKGTQEYIEQLKKANEEARGLIETYGLYDNYYYDSEGIIRFTKGALEEKQNYLDIQAKEAKATEYGTKAVVAGGKGPDKFAVGQTGSRADQVAQELFKRIDNGELKVSALEKTTKSPTNTNGPMLSELDSYKAALNEITSDLISTYVPDDAYGATFGLDEARQNLQNILIETFTDQSMREKFANYSLDSDKNFAQVFDNFQQGYGQYITSKNVDKINEISNGDANTQAIIENIVANRLSETEAREKNITGQLAQIKKDAYNTDEGDLKKLYKEEIQDLNGGNGIGNVMNDEDLARLYAREVLGREDWETLSYDGGSGKGTLKDDNTAIEGMDEKSDEEMRRELYQKAKVEELYETVEPEGSDEAFFKAIDKITNSTGELEQKMGADFSQAILTSLQNGVETIDFSSILGDISIDELNTLQGIDSSRDLLNQLGLDAVDVTKAGYESAEAFYNAFKNGIDNIDSADLEAAFDAKLQGMVSKDAEAYELDEENLQEVAKGFQELADSGDKAYETIKDDAEGIADAATRYKRLNNAIEDLNKNYEEYSEVLNDVKKATNAVEKNDRASTESAKKLKKSLADLLDTSEELIDTNFLEAIDPKDFQAAASGDEAAINRIRNSFIDAQADALNFEGDIAGLKSALADVGEGTTIEVDETPALEAMIRAMAQAGYTADQIESALSGFGIDCDITPLTSAMAEAASAAQGAGNAIIDNLSMDIQDNSVTTTDTDTKEDVGFDEEYTFSEAKATNMVMKNGADEATPVDTVYNAASKTITPKKKTETENKTQTVHALQVSNAHKSAGGKVASSNKQAAGGGGGGGGKGGKGGTSSKPAKKSRVTKKTDTVDRYKETNDQLNKIKDTIEDTSREMDTLWGPKRLKVMDKYGKSLQKQIQIQEKYKQEIVDSLAIDKKAIQDFMKEMPNGEIGGLGDLDLSFNFDENGFITNYTGVMTTLHAKLNEMENYKNSLGTEEAQSEYEDSTLGPFKERIDELKDLIGQYDDTKQLLMDADNEYQEMIIEWQQNNYDQTVYKVELQVEFSELQLEQVEYYLDKIQDDWYSAAEGVTLYGDQIVPLTNNIQSYIEMLDKLKTKLNNKEINQAQYMEGLKETQSGLIDNINTLQDALDSMGEYYLNTLDQINEKLDIQTSKFDGLTSVLEHYKEITTLINGEQDYKTLNNIVKSQRKLAEDQLAVSERKLMMYENQKAQVQSEIDKAKLLQDDEIRKQTLDKLEQDMAEIDNLIADEQSSIMEHITTLAELAMEELTNTLAEAKKRMEKAILGGEGLSIDSMLSQIERLNTKQEEYLTNTNKLYETNKLIRQAQMDMDKTDNQRAKQHYNDYIKYIEQLQQSGQLTQFELEMAQAEYDVLQKKIALEEAQEAKNQVRLTRDSEGNYGYIYTANQENIDKAEQEFTDAQNARYNKALEGAKKYQDQYYQAIADMESALEELEEERANHLITDEEYEKRRAEIVDTYLTIAETSYELYFKATGIMMEESSNNLLDYELKGVGNMENLRDATERYIEDSNKAFTTYDQKIDEVALHGEENFGKVEEGIKDVEKASQDLVLEINNKLISTMENELAETLTNSMKQWYELATAIKTVREEAEKAMDVIQKETKLEGGFITDYSDEIAKELEKGEKADYEYINSLLAARDKKMGYLDTYDYSQMMEDYLAGGGKGTDAMYKAYELLRKHKIDMWNNIDFDQMLKDYLANSGKIDDEKAKKILQARAQKINVLGVTGVISNEELIKQLTGGNISTTTETATVSEEKKEDSAAAPDLVVGNKIEVKSGTKWYGSSAGTGGTGTARGGTIKYINEGSNYPYNIDGLGWIKKSDIVGYNTGGYTGDWGPEGKLAVLHEKELVLNAQDTENFLGGIAVLREINQMLDNNALIASLGAINLHAMTIGTPADQILQQEVTIHADFPNVTDHNEIEIAIDNLINAASQHAYQV